MLVIYTEAATGNIKIYDFAFCVSMSWEDKQLTCHFVGGQFVNFMDETGQRKAIEAFEESKDFDLSQFVDIIFPNGRS